MSEELCLGQAPLYTSHPPVVEGLPEGPQQELGDQLDRPGLGQELDDLFWGGKGLGVVVQQIHSIAAQIPGAQVNVKQGKHQCLPELCTPALGSSVAVGLCSLGVSLLVDQYL